MQREETCTKNLLVIMMISFNVVGLWRIGLIGCVFISKSDIHWP